MGQVGQVRRVGQVGQVGQVGVVCFSVLGAVIRCLYFGDCSLILRSSYIFRISKVKGRCEEKNFLFVKSLNLLIGKLFLPLPYE